MRELNRQTPPMHEDMTPILNQQWEDATVNPEHNMSNYFRTIPQKSNPSEVRSFRQTSGILPQNAEIEEQLRRIKKQVGFEDEEPKASVP